MAILIGAYLNVVLIYISVLTYDMKYLLICLFAIFFGEMSVKVFGPCFNQVICVLTVEF